MTLLCLVMFVQGVMGLVWNQSRNKNMLPCFIQLFAPGFIGSGDPCSVGRHALERVAVNWSPVRGV